MEGRVVHSLLQLLERWKCHIWLVDKMKFVSLEAYFGGGWGRLNRHVSISYLLLRLS